MPCAIDSKVIGEFISNVVGKDKWKVKRIINNTTFSDKATCIIEFDDYWARVEFFNANSGNIHYYHLDDLNFIDFYFCSGFCNIKELTQELNYFCESD